MFEDFSFSTAPRQSSSNSYKSLRTTNDTSIDTSSNPPQYISPTCTSFQNHIPYSTTNVPQQHNEQYLSPRIRRADSGYNSERSSFSEADTNLSTHLSNLQLSESPSHIPSLKRSQRQDSTRMQTDDFHLREISTLVQRMVDNSEQCTLCRPSTSHSERSETPEEETDEGLLPIGENESERPAKRPQLQFRRSCEALRARPGVSKGIRMRKSRSRLNAGTINTRR
ncbi:MAG: hypothetical protein M1820_006029 [Bogoriella megaspora]|nr:MAG: hypothetical protein M1820_006029 [Bogoriella megaspora]